MNVTNLDALMLAEMMKCQDILLIDVREPIEFEKERIKGAVLAPLSTFDPDALPSAQGRKVVFMCAGGIRSLKALQQCHAAGLSYDTHLKGGIGAWKACGLPTEK